MIQLFRFSTQHNSLLLNTTIDLEVVGLAWFLVGLFIALLADRGLMLGDVEGGG